MTMHHTMPQPSLCAKPTGLLRRFLKLPNLLYRRHLGWLLGHRFLLLAHRGRKTGLIRRTVLEVVYYDPATRESGSSPDWARRPTGTAPSRPSRPSRCGPGGGLHTAAALPDTRGGGEGRRAPA